MSYGPGSVFAGTMSAAVGSFSVDVTRSWDKVYLQIPTCSSSSALDVYCSADGGTTFYQLRHEPTPNTTTVAAPSFIIAATAMANGSIVPIPGGFKNYKIKTTDSAPAGALGFKVICGA